MTTAETGTIIGTVTATQLALGAWVRSWVSTRTAALELRTNRLEGRMETVEKEQARANGLPTTWTTASVIARQATAPKVNITHPDYPRI